jgi:hypothetical protein
MGRRGARRAIRSQDQYAAGVKRGGKISSFFRVPPTWEFLLPAAKLVERKFAVKVRAIATTDGVEIEWVEKAEGDFAMMLRGDSVRNPFLTAAPHGGRLKPTWEVAVVHAAG